MEYHTVVSSMTVVGKGKSIMDESATTISIDDAGGGPFVAVSQPNGSIEIGVDEWPMLLTVISQMLENCKKVGGQ